MRLHARTAALALAAATLAGCAADPEPQTVYLEANRVPQQPAPVVKEVPVPVAIPVLRRLPSTRPASPTVTPEQAVADATRLATGGPTPDGFIAAVQTYPYVPGTVYEVFASPGHVTTLMLCPGEQLLSKVAGDTAQWMVADARAGSGAGARTLVLLKPVRPDIETNLVLATSERVYAIDLHSVPDAYHSAVQWTYPADLAAQVAEAARTDSAAQAAVIEPGVRLSDLDFGYRITAQGDAPDWMPRQAFTDGRKTYLAFPRDLATKEAPPLFMLGRRGEAELVNYRVRGNYYVVDQVVRKAELRLGQDPQQVVVIERTEE
jgi:P-type conjugative transfer protein TrbG